MKITITLPDTIAERVSRLPDREGFVLRAVEAALATEPQAAPSVESKPSKWAQIVERIEKQPTLGSYAAQLDKDRREFRRSLRFPHDEP